MKTVEDFLQRNLNKNKNNIYFIHLIDFLLMEWSLNAQITQ